MDENAAHELSGAQGGGFGVVDGGAAQQNTLTQSDWMREQLVRKQEENIFWVGAAGFDAWEDRLIVLEHEFRSGYECATCNKAGTVACEGCSGSGYSAVVEGAKCSRCNATGRVTCPECHGKGELLVVPEQSARRPTTGTIISIGPKVQELKRDQQVLYADYIGNVMDMSYEDANGVQHKCCLRILRESEILCKIHGHLDLRRMRRKVNMSDHAA